MKVAKLDSHRSVDWSKHLFPAIDARRPDIETRTETNIITSYKANDVMRLLDNHVFAAVTVLSMLTSLEA